MAEKRTIELEIQDNSKSLKAQYREAVQELQKLSATYGETSDQAAMAAKKAAEEAAAAEDSWRDTLLLSTDKLSNNFCQNGSAA